MQFLSDAVDRVTKQPFAAGGRRRRLAGAGAARESGPDACLHAGVTNWHAVPLRSKEKRASSSKL